MWKRSLIDFDESVDIQDIDINYNEDSWEEDFDLDLNEINLDISADDMDSKEKVENLLDDFLKDLDFDIEIDEDEIDEEETFKDL